MPTLKSSNQTPAVPLEYAGQWIVWSTDLQRIIAHGASLDEAKEAARQQGEVEYVFEKSPRLGPFVGSGLR